MLAARGAVHEAVTPDPGEEDRIRSRCAELGIDAASVTFRIGLSHEVLPRWEPRPLDLVLIDGAHGFPYPILDWWHVAPHVRIGGTVLLDDAYLPAIAAIVDYARSSDAWRVDDAVSFRTARLTKLADEQPPVHGRRRRRPGEMRFGYLPPHRRVVASTRQRVFSTRGGLWRSADWEAVRTRARRPPLSPTAGRAAPRSHEPPADREVAATRTAAPPGAPRRRPSAPTSRQLAHAAIARLSDTSRIMRIGASA